MVGDVRRFQRSNLELLKNGSRVKIDRAVDLLPNSHDQLVERTGLEYKLFRYYFLPLWKISCVNLHLPLMLAVILLNGLVLRDPQATSTFSTGIRDIGSLFIAIRAV